MSNGQWKLVPVEPTREMLDAARFYREGEHTLATAYRAMLAAAPDAPSAEPVAWMSPGKERLEFSRQDTVYGSHTLPLYALPPDAAAEIARMRATNRELNRRCQRVESALLVKVDSANSGVDVTDYLKIVKAQNTTIAQQAERIAELERDLNDFHMAVEHVTENGNTKRSFSTSEGWAMVHKDRLTDLEIAEERITAQSAALAESRANDRQGMAYLAQVRKVVGGADFPDMVSRVEAQAAALAKAKEALEGVCDSDEECQDSDGWTAAVISFEALHEAQEALETIAQFDGAQAGEEVKPQNDAERVAE